MGEKLSLGGDVVDSIDDPVGSFEESVPLRRVAPKGNGGVDAGGRWISEAISSGMWSFREDEGRAEKNLRSPWSDLFEVLLRRENFGRSDVGEGCSSCGKGRALIRNRTRSCD